jgi:lipopolysaccharide cholinephosphotransferase
MVTMQQLQHALLLMLEDIDDICNRYNIKYSLASGTAIGAVRHHGFIPWDDDLDILMIREEYEKFLAVPENVFKDKGYTIQKEFSNDWPMTYSKVRKDGTTYIENYEAKIQNAHQGIFIDVFPIDNLSDSEFTARFQWIVFKLLAAKELRKRGYKTNSLVKKATMLFATFLPEKPMVSFVQAKKLSNSKRVHCFLGAAIHRERNIFLREDFSNYVEITFEGRKFPIMEGFDEYLTASYGDYMKLPPESQRSEHIHAQIIDLDHSYRDNAVKIEKRK